MPTMPAFTSPLPALFQSARLREIEQQFADQPLMTRAGTAAADWAEALCQGNNSDKTLPVLVCVGPGNNGGDAVVMARLLKARGWQVMVVYQASNTALPPDAVQAHADWLTAGGSYLDEIPEAATVPCWGLVVDGVFGIGLKRAPFGQFAAWIGTMNTLAQRGGCPLLALDCPSGLDADTGMVPGGVDGPEAINMVVQATHTLTFIAAKPGLYTLDGPDCCGEIRQAALALPVETLPPDGELVTSALFTAALQPRRKNSHKGSHGSAGILGGASSMVGAALLAGRAALYLGAGRVYLGLLDLRAPGFDPEQAELMLRTGDSLLTAPLTALACGPGMGTSSSASHALAKALHLHLPAVLDADALNLLSSEPELQAELQKRKSATILTPHPAEAARLLGIKVAQVSADRIAAATILATRYRSWIVLKGCGSVIAAPEGRWWINPTGNPGMGSAGMGDVLTGMLVALLAQGWPVQEAVLAGVYLHGLAADSCVAAGQGPVGLTAGELIPAARRLLNGWIAGMADKQQ